MQNVVLSILKVSEHNNQPELEHELLPQYVIDTGEHDDNVCFFRNNILQYETAICNMSSAEDLDTSSGDRFLLSINLHFAHFQIASTTHYSSSHPNGFSGEVQHRHSVAGG